MRSYLVVDLEATCWARDPPAPGEIIEIGAVAFEPGRGVTDEFQTFVKPKLEPVLSEFCKDLTTIRQADVDAAPPFPEALEAFHAWGAGHRPYLLTSWGRYDYGQLARDCELHGLPMPFSEHLDLKRAFARLQGCRPCGMGAALRKLGMPLQGTHHRGLDDARNIAGILAWMLAVWEVEEIRG